MSIEKSLDICMSGGDCKQCDFYGDPNCGLRLSYAKFANANKPKKWIDDGFLGRLTCSNCGKWIGEFTGNMKLNYCPDCGCEMEVGKVESKK